jgi:hypothetical protein
MIAASGWPRRKASTVARARTLYSAGFSRGSQKLARLGSFQISQMGLASRQRVMAAVAKVVKACNSIWLVTP